MAIEFINQPPREASDIKVTPPFEGNFPEYSKDGIDSVWAQVGEADASEVFVSIVEHMGLAELSNPSDYELIRQLLHEGAQTLDESVRDSYLAGVNGYIDNLKRRDVTNSLESSD